MATLSWRTVEIIVLDWFCLVTVLHESVAIFLSLNIQYLNLLVKPLFLQQFEPDQSAIKKIFYDIVKIHNVGDF